MLNLSYNLSSPLEDSLQKIELLRRQILLTPLSPKVELRLRWEAMINRIYWSLVLSDNPLTKAEMVKLITTTQRKKGLNEAEQEVVNYKKAFDYIAQNWLVSSARVTPRTVLTLHDIASSGRFRSSEGTLKQFLDYLQTGSENPIIQAAIAQIQLVAISPFTDGNGRTARLLANLFLYKGGLDFRGLLILEEYWRRDLMAFKENTQKAIEGNLTGWLEYFAQTLTVQLEKAVESLAYKPTTLDLPNSFWNLNDRQKEVLNLLEKPNTTITNKKVQKLFRISQITASRDLAKLAILGLLLAHGKGRSVYYTRV